MTGHTGLKLPSAQRRLLLLLLGVSAQALACGTAHAQATLPAAPPPGSQNPDATGNAQEGSGDKSSSDDPAGDDIVVRGIVQSLASAQQIKRNSDTVVDAITAEDIGALPDRSVTEALQRVPGVSISRFFGANDPDHFAVEGQGVVIRGLPFVESQFNGRDAFSANGTRALSFQDVPPEYLAAVEIYKNQTADQIEGGIAGNVNLITRRPLDSEKNIYAFTAGVNYGDLNKVAAPEVSGLISHQWDTGIGRIGVLGSASYSRLFSRSEALDITAWTLRRNADPTRNIAGVGQPLAGLTPGENYYLPVGGGARDNRYDRIRRGYSAALQWESTDRSLLATFQFIRSDTTDRWNEDTFDTVEDFPAGNLQLLPGGLPLTFDSKNRLLTGSFTTPQYQGAYPGLNGIPPEGVPQSEQSRGRDQLSITNDYSAHLHWQAAERLQFDFDAQYADAHGELTDIGLYTSTWANETFDLSGDTPHLTLTAPRGARYADFTDPQSTFYRAAIDHLDNNNGKEYAFRADGQFDFADDSFLKRVKFGGRYGDRSQELRSSIYNWGNLSEVWNGTGPVFVSDIAAGDVGLHEFGNDFFRGGGTHVPSFSYLRNQAVFYDQTIAANQSVQAITAAPVRCVGGAPCTFDGATGTYRNADGSLATPLFGTSGRGGFVGWVPIPQRGNVLDGTFVTASELSSNAEKTYAGYLRLDFGRDHLGGGDAAFDGNVGLRVVYTKTRSSGFIQFPRLADTFPEYFNRGEAACAPAVIAARPTQPTYDICANTPTERAALVAFADGSFAPIRTRDHYLDWLPSVNLRLKARPDLQFRFAYSRALTRPTFQQVQDYQYFDLYQPPATGTNNPIPGYRANAPGNPLLRPIRSHNFDLTAEWYFSRVGSLTVAAFYKKLSNVYSAGDGTPIYLFDAGGQIPTRTYTNGSGATQTATFNGIYNNGLKVDIRGFEVDYQQTFAFLPSPLDGLGFNGNYTFIDADDVPGLQNIYGATLQFPGLSRHNFNAEVFYEKYGVSARAAYSWRSKYLITARDVVYPTQPTFVDNTGQLDASIFYDINPNIKIGATANNLLSGLTRNLVQINADGLTASRILFQNDRRFSLALRVRY